MRLALPFVFASLALGCADPQEELVCDEVVEGRYHAAQGFGMPMDLEIQFDAETCTFTATRWSAPDRPEIPMSHSDRMLGGVVDGTAVELHGTTAYWDRCPGELVDEGTRIEGICDGDTTYEFYLKD